MSTEPRIDIAFGFDHRYVPHGANVMASIARNAPGANIRFIVLHSGVTRDRQKLVETVAPDAEFLWIEVGDDDLPAYADRGHLNRAVLFRLGLETLVPADCDRILYIDADTIVVGDVRELWNVDLGENAVGFAKDVYVSADEFAAKWSLPGEGAVYFNAGVEVIDLAKVRAGKLFSQALDFVVKHDSELLLGDQDALNYVFWRKWTPIPQGWNMQRVPGMREHKSAHKAAGSDAPRLIHYIGTDKPWLANAWHPWAWLYWEALRKTPFFDEVCATYKIDFYQLTRWRLRYWLRRPKGSGIAR